MRGTGDMTASTARAKSSLHVGITLRSLARGLLDDADRALHDLRRLWARRRIQALTRVRRVLFVCHGNVCRSPFAAEVFRELMLGRAGVQVEVASAGFIGPGRQSPVDACHAALRRGRDLSAHVSNLVDASSVSTSDLIVVMSAAQASAVRQQYGSTHGLVVVLGDLDPHPIRQRTVQDPWGRDQATFDESFERIERCVASLIDTLAAATNPPGAPTTV